MPFLKMHIFILDIMYILKIYYFENVAIMKVASTSYM